MINKAEIIGSMEGYLKNLTLEHIKASRGEKFRFPIYMGNKLMETDIEELELSVRSQNCLKRAGYRTIGDIVTHIDRKEDLLKLRNLGRKSADEIVEKIFYYQYSIMPPEKQEKYMNRVLELNELL